MAITIDGAANTISGLVAGGLPSGSVTSSTIADGTIVDSDLSTTEWARSLAASGYQKLPGGLTIQWGTVIGAVSPGTAVTFPIAFPTACRGVWLNNIDGLIACAAATITTSGFNAVQSSGTSNMRWLAIGH